METNTEGKGGRRMGGGCRFKQVGGSLEVSCKLVQWFYTLATYRITREDYNKQNKNDQ